MTPQSDRDPALIPMSPPEAKHLARDIMENGDFEVSGHAIQEMRDDDLNTTDVVNVIRGGVYHAPELEKGEWRYRISTARMSVVIVFRSRERLRVVTAWRN